MQNENIKKLILTALFAALCFVGTTVIKLPSPTGGYIHLGDGFVLLSGVFLGPAAGAFAAGLGSMLSDLLGGYLIYAPATFVIKAGSALLSALLYGKLQKTLLPSIAGEAFMVLGYFLFESLYSAAVAGFGGEALKNGLLYGLSGVGFNVIQGIVGAAIAVLLTPLIAKALKAL